MIFRLLLQDFDQFFNKFKSNILNILDLILTSNIFLLWYIFYFLFFKSENC